jgi:superfamily II DNA or RNA helicase
VAHRAATTREPIDAAEHFEERHVPTTTLWPHQRDAVEAIRKVLTDHDRAVLHMACGTGKTRVGGEIAVHLGRAGHGRVLLVVPSLELISQTLREWIDAFGRTALGRLVAVCSEPRVLARYRTELERDAVVTGHPAELAHLMTGTRRATVACTYQSLQVLVAAHATHRLPRWDALVIDEAHRTVGAAERPWAVVHDDRLIPADRRLNMTATPRAAVGEGRMIGMQDEAAFGPIGFRLSFGVAIELGLLARYRVVVPVVTDEQIRRSVAAAERPEYLQVGSSAVAAGMLATQIAVLRAAQEFDSRRMVTFHSSVADAQWFAKTLPYAREEQVLAGEDPPTLWAGHVSGRQPLAQRRRVLDQLRSADDRVVVVSNAKVLTEGVNIPEIDAVCFMRPRSAIDTIQAVGRALRRGDRTKAKTATIIVPVVLGPGEDPETALSGSAYAAVFGVVRALAAHDDSLALHLDEARRSLGSCSDPGVRHDLPDWLTVTGIAVPAGFADAITVRTVREATDPWSEFICAATAYRDKHGHTNVPRGWVTPQGLPLGGMVEYRRTRQGQAHLSAEQVAELAALGIVWNSPDVAWERFIADLTEFRDLNGHIDVPQDHVNPGGRKLGIQVATRRRSFGELPAERAAELLALGFVLNAPDHRWRRNLDAWLAFLTARRHHIVPRDHVTADGFKLGRWRIHQLGAYHAGRMPPWRADLITTHRLHLSWHELNRQRHIDALRLFADRHGHVRVPHDHVTDDDLSLGKWLIHQRGLLRAGDIDPEHARELRELGVRTTRGGA